MKQSDFLDLVKYILALMVVAIHTGLFPYITFPWIRLAVPLFFIISSYFLFVRINSADEDGKIYCVKKYVLRNLQFYLFWFIILLPYTVMARKEWFSDGVLNFVRIFITHLLFGYTFSASWFIVASIWAVIILFITRKIPEKIYIPILLFVYAFCCMRSSYYFIFMNNKYFHNIAQYYEFVFTNPVNSFPVALCWMYIGKIFADRRIITSDKKTLVIGVIAFSIGLWGEWKIISLISGNISAGNDCFFFLVPLSICIFALVKEVNRTIKNAKILRTISIVMFPLHASLTGVIRYVLDAFWGIHYEWALFLIVVISCHIVTFGILRLENKKIFRFLKYSH